MITSSAFVIAAISALAATTPQSCAVDANTCQLDVDYAVVQGGGFSPQLAPKPGLFGLMRQDFVHLVSRDNLYLLGVGAGASLIMSGDDDGLAREVVGKKGFDHFFGPGEIAGGVAVQLGGSLATFAVGKLTGNRALFELGQDLVRAQILGQTLTQGLKLTASRRRPDGSNEFSFPSGHTSGAFATATVLQDHFGWKAGVPAYALSSYIAMSRISAQRHHLSDVVFGAAVGIVAGRTVTLGNSHRRINFQPFAATDGFGLDVVVSTGRRDR